MDEEDMRFGENYLDGEAASQSSLPGIKESEFIPLDDLVYAPLHALAVSNQQLRSHVVEAIKSMGVPFQNGAEETVQLSNMNIAYEQVRPEGDEGYSVDNLQMQVPLLSIVPITNLNVEKAQIEFATEVKVEKGPEGACSIAARICSPEQRESDFLPRVSYSMEIRSIPATEGVMRLADLLSANQIAKKIDTTPVAPGGNLGTEDQKNAWQEVSRQKAKIKKYRQLYRKVEEMIAEQERLQQISRDAYAADTREFDKEKYLMVQSDLANRIMACQEVIMDMEIAYGMEAEYE